MRHTLLRILTATALLALSGCYAYPYGPYGYGPAYGPAYAGPVVAVPAPSIYVGGGWGHGWGGGGYGHGWR